MNKMIMTEHEGLRLVGIIHDEMLPWFRELTPEDIGRKFYYDRHGGPPWIAFVTDAHELVDVTKDGPVSRDEHYARLNVYPLDPVVGERWEITEEIYWEFLEVLPPMHYRRFPGGESFLMSEMTNGDITSKYTHYQETDGDHYFHEFVEVDRKIQLDYEMGW